MKFSTIAISFSIVASVSAHADARPQTKWDKSIYDVANKELVPAPLLAAICYVESHHQPELTNFDDGNSNSIGLCQIKLETAQLMGYTGTLQGLYNGKTNAKWAARYLKWQLNRFKGSWELATSAYNMGTPKCKRGTKVLANQGYVDKVFEAIKTKASK